MMIEIPTLESPPSNRSMRACVFGVVSKLHELDTLLMDLCERLPLPADVSEMWELHRPMSFSAHLYGSLEAVRSDLHEAVRTLLEAARHDEESLRIAFIQQQRDEKSGVSFGLHTNQPPGSREKGATAHAEDS